MQLQEDESIVRNIHHHPITFAFRALNRLIISIPFFFVAAFFSGVLNPMQMFIVYAVITVIFSFIIFSDLMLFYLDRLVITSRRIVHIDWKTAFERSEHEAELVDIQDIDTEEAGILSLLPIFDFGVFRLETASTRTTIVFKDAPDPESIKHFIYHLNLKPHRIGAENVKYAHDSTRQTYNEEAAVSRRQ